MTPPATGDRSATGRSGRCFKARRSLISDRETVARGRSADVGPGQIQRGIGVAYQIPGLIQSDNTGVNDQKIDVLGTLGPEHQTIRAATVAAKTHQEEPNIIIFLNLENNLFILEL